MPKKNAVKDEEQNLNNYIKVMVVGKLLVSKWLSRVSNSGPPAS